MKQLLSIIILACAALGLRAQDMEGFWDEIRQRWQDEPIRLHGAFSASGLYNSVTGIPARRDRYNWNLNANLNFDILGIEAPFSLNIADGNLLYGLPSYQFAGISPRYKWITLHAGDRSMNFSPYTLFGHNFTGAGLELRPGKLRLAAMYGRLRRANAGDYSAFQNLDPAFRRMGGGLKIGYGDAQNFVDLIVFSARDDAQALDTSAVRQLAPAENLVLGLTGRAQLSPRLAFQADLARSLYSADLYAPRLGNGNLNFGNSLFGLFDPRSSTVAANALKLGLDLNLGRAGLQMLYERIDPGYRSMGTLFINDDLENYTLGAGFQLLQGRLSVALNGGLQRNNLDQQQASALLRYIGSANLSYTASERLSLNLNYSNFYNTQKLRANFNPEIPVDSLFLAQINQNISFGANMLLDPQRKSTLSVNAAYQNAQSLINDVLQPGSTDFYNANLAYSQAFERIKLRLSLGANTNYIIGEQFNSLNIGPFANLSKTWLRDKLQANLTFSYTEALLDGARNNQVFNTQVSGRYNFLKGHSLNARYSLIARSRPAAQLGANAFSEHVVSLLYAYSF